MGKSDNKPELIFPPLISAHKISAIVNLFSDGGWIDRTKSQAAGEPRRLAYMELDHHKLDSITRPAADDEG